MQDLNDVTQLLRGGLKVGEAQGSGSLTLVPLHGGLVGPNYVLAADAIAGGALAITEVAEGSVPQLVADNSGDQAVLILDGEHLEGAMQDRVLNTTVLLAARMKTLLPVSCVESGRWHYEQSDSFASSPDFSYSRLRRANIESVSASIRSGMGHHSDQGRVWDEVASKHEELGVADSDTGAMKDAYSSRSGELEEIIAGFDRPGAGQTGVVALIGGHPTAIDAFDKAETFDRLWPRLVRSYALDALGTPQVAAEAQAAEQFLAVAAEAEKTAHEGVGIGTDVVITGSSVIGKALWSDGAVLHLSLFTREQEGQDDPHMGQTINSPHHRRARRRIY